MAKSALLQIEVLLDSRRGSSRLWLYCSQQSSSRVSAATVRIAPAASQARCAELACAFLFFWSFNTTTRCPNAVSKTFEVG